MSLKAQSRTHVHRIFVGASRTVKDKKSEVVAYADTLPKLIEDGKHGQEQIFELDRQLALYQKKLERAFEGWKDYRKKTVELLRELANQIKTHENNSRIAKLFGASSSIIGLSLAIGGAVGAMFTFGGSLILTAVGCGIAAAGGITVTGTNVVNALLRNTNVKLVEDAVKKDREVSREIQDLLEKIQALCKGVDIGMSFGNIDCNAKEAAFQIGAPSVFTVAGITYSELSIPFNVYTLVSTSYKGHKGSVLKVVEDILEVAQKLEDKMNVFGDVNHENQRDIFAE